MRLLEVFVRTDLRLDDHAFDVAPDVVNATRFEGLTIASVTELFMYAMGTTLCSKQRDWGSIPTTRWSNLPLNS
jgi:hypothetical protein